MDFEALVHAVTEKVLAELCKAPGSALSSTCGVAESALVLAMPDFAHAAALEGKIRARVGQEIRLEFFKGPEAGQKASRYLIPYICCPDMAALATGRATGPVTRKALDLLLAGEKVEVLEYEYSRHAATAPRALYTLYAGYEKTLASFGLVKFEEKKDGLMRLRENLVTEKTVKEAAAGGMAALLVPSGALVTALARDAAEELGLDILKDGEI
jgi:hypothetical protein